MLPLPDTDRLWLEATKERLEALAWSRVNEVGHTLKVEQGTNADWVDVFCDRTALLMLAAACLDGATSSGPLWSHAIDKASYADMDSVPLELHLKAAGSATSAQS